MIKKMTQEQIDKMPHYVDKWLKIGLGVGDCDLGESIKAAKRAYKTAGLSEPKYFYIFDSPLSAAIAEAMIALLAKNQLQDQVLGQVRDQVWGQVQDQVWDQVRGQVHAQVRAQVHAQVLAQVQDQVRDQVWDQLYERLFGNLSISSQRYGCHESGWMCFYDFINTELKTKKTNLLVKLGTLAGLSKEW